ncbi:MAG TPA: TetR/AcrR family transcriptional regulator [Gammaproteobacteria bacterium]|nr:TetR/AcrR family transcriptional regulator [Gammaproteobacteria bacterium]
MQPKPVETTSDSVRVGILDAAEARFRIYGLNKTTMAEIAHDMDMSASNLYRYFKNKQDIAAACACRCIDTQTDLLRGVVRTPGLSAAEKLERCALEMLRYTWETAHDQPRINELVNHVILEHRDMVHHKVQESCSLLAEVLAQGNESGEFEVADVVKTAETVHAALKMFHVPIFMSLYAHEVLMLRARDVVALLISGLRGRDHEPSQ